MQRHAAVYRVEKTLKEGVEKMYDVYKLFHDVKVADRGLVWNTDLIETLELENLLGTVLVNCSSGDPDDCKCLEPEGVQRSSRER